jgi:DNA-binding CsgD family transcriptional regulator
MSVPIANCAILDRDGVILEVNEAWRQFGIANGLCTPDAGVGQSYLRFCTFADPASSAIVSDFRALLDGRRDLVSFLYDCHSEREERWFTAVGFPEGGSRFIVSHVNVTDLIRAGRALPVPVSVSGNEPPAVADGEAADVMDKLRPRQREILVLLAHGKTNREIAAAFATSPHTVRNQVSTILRRLKLKNRVGAARLWGEREA